MRPRFALIPAAFVVLRRGRQVTLLRRADTGYRDGFWALPAGHVESGESCRAAAARELREETGVDLAPRNLRPLCTQHGTAPGGAIEQRVDFYFEAECPDGIEPIRAEPDKASELRWCDLDDLPDPVVPPELAVLTAVRSGAVPAILTFGFDGSLRIR